ncbi:MAG: phospholipase A2 [Ilumatobacteraceae bacterium]
MNKYIVVAIMSVASFAPSGAQAATPSASIDRLEALVFGTPLPTFLDIARKPGTTDRSFDWSSDLCSAPLIGSTGRSFDFSGPCRRHDFAYRNFKSMDRITTCQVPPTGGTCRTVHMPSGHWWNSASRHRIDRQFLSDMLAHCTTRSGATKISCRSWAQVFYRSVRVAGGP